MEEIWKEIEGTNGAYQISNLGNVKNSKFDRLVKTALRVDGYSTVRLFLHKGNIPTKQIHRLVAQAFISNPDNLPCVMHINDIRSDNRVENLKWGTHRDNIKDCYAKERDNGGIKQMKIKIKELEKELEFYKEKFGSLN